MRIEHAAIWTDDLERLKAFYEEFLGAKAGRKYVNESKRFESYFLEFDGGARLELMTRSSLLPRAGAAEEPALGYAHVAFGLGAHERVVALTEKLRAAGYTIVDGPRTTGDGYFESVALDPDGNRIELTV